MAARAQDSPADLQQRRQDVADALAELKARMVDLAVPDSPAFTVLGLTPEEIAPPTTGRALAASLLNGVDRRGVLQSGVAVDTLPYLALAGHLLTLDGYRGRAHYPVRFLARTQISLATAKASDADDKGMRVALGVRMTVLDFGDPRTDASLDACVETAIALPDPPLFVVPPPPDPPDAESLRAWQAQMERGRRAEADYAARVNAWRTTSAEEVRRCREDARQRAWNRTRWIVAVAPTWTSVTGAAGDLTRSGSGAWTTFGYGFEGVPGLQRNAQVLLHARYRNDEMLPAPEAAATRRLQDSRLLGVQLRAGTANSTVAVEALFERVTPAGLSATSDRRYSIGYERRLADNLWLGVALGSGAATVGEEAKGGFLLSSLKWGFTESASLGLPQ
jgi:hypothetical protein